MKTLLLATLLFSLNASAWGPTGHRVVGEVAEKFLEPAIKLKINNLLKGEGLARVANWSDEIKSDPDHFQQRFYPSNISGHNPAEFFHSLL